MSTKKTEHAGAKNQGNSAYYGSRRDAKLSSRKARRANDRKAVKAYLYP